LLPIFRLADLQPFPATKGQETAVWPFELAGIVPLRKK
jgi:hypothetical protein